MPRKTKAQKEAEEIAKKLQTANANLASAQDQLQNMAVVTKTTGFTFRVGIGLTYIDKLNPEIDAKLFYTGHFSGVVGLVFNPSDMGDFNLFTAATCHINLFTPIDWNLNNTELGIGPCYSLRDQRFKLLLLLRSNL